MEENKFMNFVKNNLTSIIVIWILFTTLSPFFFTLKFEILDFTNTGQIGDTIGGITSPIINILNAILIYIAFTEQLKANNILKEQIDLERNKEINRIENIKKLVIHDLEKNIKPNLKKISEECKKYLKAKEEGKVITVNDFVDFNDNIFQNISHSDLLLAFDDEFQDIMIIYARVKFISSVTPLRISHKYPTDPNGLSLINIEENNKVKLIKNHNEKIKTTLNGVINITIPAVEDKIKWIKEKRELFEDPSLSSGL